MMKQEVISKEILLEKGKNLLKKAQLKGNKNFNNKLWWKSLNQK